MRLGSPEKKWCHGLRSQRASPPVHLAIPLCFPSGCFLLSHHTLSSNLLTMPFSWQLFLTLSPGSAQPQAAPPPKHLSVGAEGQQVARQYQGIEASGAFQLLLTPQGTPAVWLCQYRGTLWGLGFLPYKMGRGEATSVSSTLPEANVKIQGDREGAGERAAGSIEQNSFQRVC